MNAINATNLINTQQPLLTNMTNIPNIPTRNNINNDDNTSLTSSNSSPSTTNTLPSIRESIHIHHKHKHIRKRSRSLSHNDSYSQISHVKNNDKKNENDMNIVHILKSSHIENEKEIKQQEYKHKDTVSEIQINNDKNDNEIDNDNANDDTINQIDIDNVINTINNIHSSIDSNDNTETIDKIVSPNDLQEISDAMMRITYRKNDKIVCEGDSSTHFFIISRGECNAYKDNNKTLILKSYTIGDCFGELSSLHSTHPMTQSQSQYIRYV